MGRAFWAICSLAALAFVWLGPMASQAAEENAADEQTSFDMKEVSIVDAKETKILPYVSGGNDLFVNNEPDTRVKAYPKLHSKQPFYGAPPLTAICFAASTESSTSLFSMLPASRRRSSRNRFGGGSNFGANGRGRSRNREL